MIILTNVNRNNRYSLSYEKIINLLNNCRYFILYDYDYYEYKKFKNYYIEYCYYKSILDYITYFSYVFILHRDDGPAYIGYHKNSEINIKLYFLNGKKYFYEDYILEINKRV